MAVTIHSTPATYSFTDNPLTYVFSSTQTGQANFSYKVEVYLNAVVVSTEQVFPESGIYAHIDISETISPLVQNPQIMSSLDIGSDAWGLIKIKVTEMYGTPATAQGTATSTETTVIKGSVSNEEFPDFDLNSEWKGIKWLTDYPETSMEVLRGQTFVYSMLVDASATLYVKFYDSSNSLLHTYSATSNYKIWQLTINETRLLTDAGISVFNLSQTAYFTIQIGTSDLMTFAYLDDYCWTPKALLWANRYGSFDTFIYAHNDIRKATIEKRSYQRQFGAWSDTTFDYDASVSGTSDFAKTRINGGTLASGYVTEAIQTWMLYVHDSPWVVVTYDIGIPFKPITLSGSSYEVQQERFEELINVVLEYKDSNKYNGLRR